MYEYKFKVIDQKYNDPLKFSEEPCDHSFYNFDW